jgi:hypothetical protein
MAVAGAYPVTLAVDYPERQSRWKTLLRLLLVIPLLIFSYLLSSGIVLAVWAAILVKGRIPRWLFEFQVAYNRWQARFGAYFLLLTDQYPPFEGEYPIRYEVQYPERLSRRKLVIWKFITSVPHFIVLAFLTFTLLAVVPLAWFSVLIAGRFPRGLHLYVAGISRWSARVQAYFFSLTDEFPPFSLAADAGPGGSDSYVISSILGVLATGGVIAGIVALAIFGRGEKVVQVSYADLLAGEVRPADTRITVDSITVELTGATDPADDLVSLLVPQPGHRFVLLDLTIENERRVDLPIRGSDFRLKDEDGHGHDAYLVIVGGRIPRVDLVEHGSADAKLVFELPKEVDPAELRYGELLYNSRLGFTKTIVYEFR